MRRFRGSAIVVLIVTGSVLLAGCGQSEATRNVSAALQQIIAGEPVATGDANVWKDARRFYELRGGAPAWVKGRSPSKRASAARHVVSRADEHGLSPDDYGEAELGSLIEQLDRSKRNDKELPTRLADLDVRLTVALLALGRDVALGRAKPEAIGAGFARRRQPPDFVAALQEATSYDPGAYLDKIQPRHREYAVLRGVLSDLRDKLEQPDPLDDFPIPAGPPVEQLIRQVQLNLERWRWMPDDFGSRHFIVNIPSFELAAREQGKTVLEMKVIVGKPGTETPIFSDEMETVVFSPYWNIPDTIAMGETAPAAIRDPSYLARNQIEILSVSGSGATRVDPSSVDWGNPDALERLAFRQRPGASNALGHVKFLFPNRYNVYLHDTPTDNLFARRTRAFSHGCVRVERPEDLAKYVLRGYSDWDDTRIRRAMHSGVEKFVPLKEKIPVHIVYFTTWVDGSGGVHFHSDLYGLDARQLAVMRP